VRLLQQTAHGSANRWTLRPRLMTVVHAMCTLRPEQGPTPGLFHVHLWPLPSQTALRPGFTLFRPVLGSHSINAMPVSSAPSAPRPTFHASSSPALDPQPDIIRYLHLGRLRQLTAECDLCCGRASWWQLPLSAEGSRVKVQERVRISNWDSLKSARHRWGQVSKASRVIAASSARQRACVIDMERIEITY
jgi:hypothetical protein